MWPFRRAHEAIENLIAINTWSIGEGTVDSKPVIASVNSATAAFIRHPDLTCLLRIFLRWDVPHPGGMPNPEESWAARVFQDALMATIQGSNQGLLVAIITSGEHREFISYVRNATAALARIDQLKRHYPGIHYSVEYDPSWSIYRELRM
jgi:hypothetical protein